MIAISDAVAKMHSLSEESAARVVSLIEELAEMEARENAADLAAAQKSLADGGEPIPWEQAEAGLDAIHGLD